MRLRARPFENPVLEHLKLKPSSIRVKWVLLLNRSSAALEPARGGGRIGQHMRHIFCRCFRGLRADASICSEHLGLGALSMLSPNIGATSAVLSAGLFLSGNGRWARVMHCVPRVVAAHLQVSHGPSQEEWADYAVELCQFTVRNERTDISEDYGDGAERIPMISVFSTSRASSWRISGRRPTRLGGRGPGYTIAGATGLAVLGCLRLSSHPSPLSYSRDLIDPCAEKCGPVRCHRLCAARECNV